MRLEDMIMVSVDDHIVEPPDLFQNQLSGDLLASAPQLITAADGTHAWIYEGKKIPNIGLNAVAGRVVEEYGCEPSALDQIRKGAWNIDARIEDMNANGLVGSLCFGSFVKFDGSLFLNASDKRAALAHLKAYNDWHIDEWCAKYPGRFIPLALMPMWDVNAMLEEIRRVHAKGCRAVSFSDNPALKKLPSIHNAQWEPFWALCAELDVVICCHIGTGYAAPHASMESPIPAWIVSMPMAIATSAADWIHLSALGRHPNLKIALSEGGIGWVPYFLERCDFTYEHHGAWTHTNAIFGGKLPSEVFKEHFLTCFIDDKFGVANRYDVGLNTICYECDYPHSDTLWPHAPERLMDNFAGVPDADIDAISHLNAMKAFSYDPFKILGRENCTVGALRAQAKHIDVTPKSYGGPAPLHPDEPRRVVTSGDVVKLYAPEPA